MSVSPDAGAAVGRIFALDAHPIVRLGLLRLVEAEDDLEIAGEAGAPGPALAGIEATEPDLVVLDVGLPGHDGLALVRRLREEWPELPVLVLSSLDESVYGARTLRAGARGFVTKREGSGTLLGAIRHVLRGEVYVSDTMKSKLLHEIAGGGPAGASPVESLSDRELQVFRMIGRGTSTRKVAEELELSVKTIETYRENIKRKLELADATELMYRAVEWVQREQVAG